ARHNTVSSAVSLTRYHGNLRHSRFGKGKQQLRAVADDPAVFLLNSRQKPWHVLEGDQRDVETVAKTDETRALNRGVYVEHARQVRRLIGDYAHRSAAKPGEAHHDVLRVVLVHFKEIAVVHHRVNDVADLVRNVGRLRDYRVQLFVDAINRIACRNPRRIIEVVRRYERQQLANGPQAVFVVLGGEMSNARN